jgi:hypothetical protein
MSSFHPKATGLLHGSGVAVDCRSQRTLRQDRRGFREAVWLFHPGDMFMSAVRVHRAVINFPYFFSLNAKDHEHVGAARISRHPSIVLNSLTPPSRCHWEYYGRQQMGQRRIFSEWLAA